MSNIIQIKHGRTKPTSQGVLAPFELGCYQPAGEDGYAHLYIGNINGIGVPIKPIGGLAEGLTDASGNLYNVGSGDTPVYFANGIPVACSADVTIGLTAEKAESLATPRTFITDLSSSTAGSFDGSANVVLGIKGTLSVAKGGTGRTTLTSGRVLVGNGTSAVSFKAIDTTVTKDSSNLITSDGVFKFCEDRYLPLAGEVLTGVLTLKQGVKGDGYNSGALNANESDIFNINGLWFGDLVNESSRGINFYNTSETADTLMAINGKLRFAPARSIGTFSNGYEVLHSGNHITLLAQNLNLTQSTSTAVTTTVEGIGDYSAYLFIAKASNSYPYDGYMQTIVPRAILSETEQRFYIGQAYDGKYFAVSITGNTMTLKNAGYSGNGITADSFCIYGIK